MSALDLGSYGLGATPEQIQRFMTVMTAMDDPKKAVQQLVAQKQAEAQAVADAARLKLQAAADSASAARAKNVAIAAAVIGGLVYALKKRRKKRG